MHFINESFQFIPSTSQISPQFLFTRWLNAIISSSIGNMGSWISDLTDIYLPFTHLDDLAWMYNFIWFLLFTKAFLLFSAWQVLEYMSSFGLIQFKKQNVELLRCLLEVLLENYIGQTLLEAHRIYTSEQQKRMGQGNARKRSRLTPKKWKKTGILNNIFVEGKRFVGQ